ncbi:PQQ-dependent sugar dehydrogenase [Amantichitinum ursilacus]|uniref:Soluble aldose sugar dehydrogenase YliI n=1 Tax=Amantichitinum ursilacus TaxID=857265 RepID=A0A0N0XLD9_9NEIS|nr:PQQ-dependent sugar dehydrogenase [Amantichitinum ursilacus]KPC55434.1 Soluble aldose sugar dehydrogenase YliI precursor [Amantichitinum ursilacus]
MSAFDKTCIAAATAGLLMTGAAFAAEGAGYVTNGQCGGLPQLPVKTAAGFCVGLAASSLGMPRGVLPLQDGHILVTDMGGWGKRKGRLLQLTRGPNGYSNKVLLEGLDRPHALQLGPDGLVYLGEAGRISRFKADAAKPKLETVLANLPDEGRHPLKTFVFGKDGSLYVNFGSATDNCDGHIEAGKPANQSCSETESDQPRGVVHHYTFKDGQWQDEIFARGLRNSMALAVNPVSGAVWQAENSRDYINRKMPGLENDENLPHEEVNLLKQGAHYGWPYCYDNNMAAPEFPNADCSRYSKPVRLMPGHAAPLGMLFYSGDAAPAAWRNSLIIGWHGYRNNGHRIVAYHFDANNQPQGDYTELVGDWADAPGKHPMGAPTDLKADNKGTIWVTEDRNGTLLALTPNGDAK